MLAILRRHRLLLTVFLAVDTLVAGLFIFFVARGQWSRVAAWETYAGSYASRSGDLLQLHDDGTWTMTYAQGGESRSGGEPDGEVVDLCWIALGRDETCEQCRDVYPAPPVGDPLIYVPSSVTAATAWSGSGDSTDGTYYGVQPNGSLVDEDGRRWTRVTAPG